MDDKGRLKLPVIVKRSLREKYGAPDLFVTSLDGNVVKVFPLKEWEVVETMLSRRTTDPNQGKDGFRKNKILFQTNRFGSEQAVDRQGRFRIPMELRDTAGMRGAVKIQWQTNHLLVMSEASYNDAAEANALSAGDLLHAANLGL